ncbi:MAG: hypothetical protein HPM95_01805 [Alphaproteobacteria bacterium]|nr:hypothetical protein [Alphaproteobacteria bacterium]
MSMAYSVSGDVSAVLQVDVADMAVSTLTARLFDDDPNVAAFTTHFHHGNREAGAGGSGNVAGRWPHLTS